MQLITKPIPISELRKLAKHGFGNLIKAVVDVKKEIIAIDAGLHSDEEALLLEKGSSQNDLWGINLYPDLTGEDFIEFDSMINLRPNANNLSRGVENPDTRSTIIDIVNSLITKK